MIALLLDAVIARTHAAATLQLLQGLPAKA
jgi:hypothetical protein